MRPYGSDTVRSTCLMAAASKITPLPRSVLVLGPARVPLQRHRLRSRHGYGHGHQQEVQPCQQQYRYHHHQEQQQQLWLQQQPPHASRARLSHTQARPQARWIHSTRRPASAATPLSLTNGQIPREMLAGQQERLLARQVHAQEESDGAPLSKVAFPSLIRSLIIQYASSRPLLFRPATAVLDFLAHTESRLFSPRTNRLLNRLLRACVYDMFCAGENQRQVTTTAKELKSWGVQGVILSWARETVAKPAESSALGGVQTGGQLQPHPTSSDSRDAAAATEARQSGIRAIRDWAAGNMQGISIANSGDMIALKLSGAGPLVLQNLQSPGDQPYEPVLMEELEKICRLAKTKGVSLCIDAEQWRLQPGIDDLAMQLSRRYNGPSASSPGSAVIYTTYQAYLKSTPAKLAADLQVAAQAGFCLGVKLVRGAYLTTEERGLIWETKEESDAAYDALAECVMRRGWHTESGRFLSAGFDSGPFPAVELLLATHNLESVKKACAIRMDQLEAGQQTVPIVFAQLMGMADHVTAAAIKAVQEESAQVERDVFTMSQRDRETAIHAAEKNEEFQSDVACMQQQHRHHYSSLQNIHNNSGSPPRVFKYLAWGTVDECLSYLVRRGEENRDAAMRTEESRRVLWQELKRRLSRPLRLSS